MRFNDIPGNAKLKTKLIQAIAENRIPHAQLFVSMEGGGNLPLALAYTQYLFCKSPQESDSCGVCEACRKVSQLAHPDLKIVFPITANKTEKVSTYKDQFADFKDAFFENPYLSISDWVQYLGKEDKKPIINVESVSEIHRDLQYKPYEANYNVVLVWLPELFFHSAVPKLLKILEEPPAQTLFLLVSNSPSDILNTILSRTQLVKLDKIEDWEMLEALTQKHGVDIQRATEIVNIANGNYNLAQWLINEEDNSESVNLFREWMLAAYRTDVPALLKFADNFHTMSRDKQKTFLAYCLHLVRESLISAHEMPELNRMTSAERSFIPKFSKFINASNANEIRNMLEKSLYYVDRNANMKIVMANISLRLMELIKDPVAPAAN